MSALSFTENIPAILKKRNQWVVWKQVQVPGRMKPTKVPFSVRTGAEASSTDADTWSSFDDALAYYRSHPDVAGIGFVFNERDPYCGIDLDECITSGQVSPEAQALIDDLASYSEISPSGNGIKIIIVGTKPEDAKCQSKKIKGMSRIEIYDHARFFTITGQIVAGTPNQVIQQQDKLTALCKTLWPPKPGVDLTEFLTPTEPTTDMAMRERRCLAYLQQCPDAISGQGGHDATLRAACECFRFGLDDAATWRVMQQFNNSKTGGEVWTEKELAHKIESARSKVQADGEMGLRLREPPPAPAVSSSPGPIKPNPTSITDLIARNPEMRPPVIHGLLRLGESANLVAAPKVGKSWMAMDLAISVATGGMFLDTFQCMPGAVLLLDNELHEETLSNRLPKVIAARRLDVATVGRNMFAESLRGQLRDLPGMESYFRGLEPGRFSLIICDAFYRFLPGGMDENDNGAMIALYNLIDRYAAITGSAFVLIHHTSKGDQSQKSITDVGSGAGAQSRAPDAHIALRLHEEDDCAVLQAGVRSWPKIEPLCLRWEYPLWRPDASLDPAALRSPGSRRSGRPPKEEPADPWTPVKFVGQFITTTPRSQAAILAAAESEGLTSRRARKMLTLAEEQGLAHRWRLGSANRADYATVPQPARGGDAAPLSHARTPHTPPGKRGMRAAFPGNHFCARVSVRTEKTMIVFVPNAKDPLIGTWCDLPRQQRVKPSAVRTIWRARTMTKYLEGGMALAQAQDDAAAETASMLGLTLRTVRAFCNLPRGPQDAARRVGRPDGTSGQADAPRRDVGQANANGGPTGGTGSFTASNLADGRGNGRAGCFCLRPMANGQ